MFIEVSGPCGVGRKVGGCRKSDKDKEGTDI